MDVRVDAGVNVHSLSTAVTAVVRASLLTAVMLGTVPAIAADGKFPNRPIRWVIPFAAGGGTDVVARPIALAMGEMLGYPVVYDNRGGGNGMIAGEIVARTAPDGYTLLVGSPAVMTTNPHLYPKMPFDSLRDFVAVAKFANAPNVLGANLALPVRNVQELIEYCKANPGKVNWASSGIGSGGHLGIELFQTRTNTKVMHVAYKGAGPALVGLIGGNTQLLLAVPGVFMPHVKAGRVRALAVGSLQRLPVLPEVPTLNESGLHGMESGSWYGLVAPTGAPVVAIKALHAATLKVLALPEIQARLSVDGALPSGNTPEQFVKDIRAESAMWGKIIKQAGIKLD